MVNKTISYSFENVQSNEKKGHCWQTDLRSVTDVQTTGICYGLNLLPVQIFLNWFIFFKLVHI